MVWCATMIEPKTRLRVARGLGPSETVASAEVFNTLKRERGHVEAPPPTVSDGYGGIAQAMIEVYGTVPEYSGRGRPPSRKQPSEDWQYLQVVKERDEHGRVTGTRPRVVFGEPEEVLGLLEAHTAYVERTHLTSRHMNGRLVRKGLGFSKKMQMHRAMVVWQDVIYNLARTNEGVREDVTGPIGRGRGRRWRERTPMMAAGLTKTVWSEARVLRTVVAPNT
jgi:hypothetical protein